MDISFSLAGVFEVKYLNEKHVPLLNKKLTFMTGCLTSRGILPYKYNLCKFLVHLEIYV